VEIGRYWKLRYGPKRRLSLPDAVAELRWHIAEAVRVRLMSDVPLGAFLSGGIDSSAVVAHMSLALDRPVRTFSVGFEEAAFDERRFARMVAERYATDHTELVVKPSVVDILPRLVWHYDEPFGDSSAVPSYAIAELTRRHVTVVLNGDGGDESFAGYDRYVVNRRARRGDLVPLGLRRRAAALIRRLPASVRQRQPWRKLASVAEAMAQVPERRYARWIGHLSPGERQDLYTTSFREAVEGSDPEQLFVEAFAQSDAEDWTDATLDTDVSLYLADDLLVKMDRATMAHSLEGRSPLLDHVLMEFVASLPATFKLAGTEKKRILKAALRGVLPDAVLDRPKMGFGAPISSWFRNELREMAQDLLLSPRAVQRAYFRPAVVARLLDEHIQGRDDHGEDLWDLLVLEVWHRTFIDSGARGHVPHGPVASAV
jgi:asparagine synthase (glutamine-hydrolysing)